MQRSSALLAILTAAVVGLTLLVASLFAWVLHISNEQGAQSSSGVLNPVATPALPSLVNDPHTPLSRGDAGLPQAPFTGAPHEGLSNEEQRTIDIFRNAAPSVVFITKLAVQRDIFRRNALAMPQGTGSGFIWDDQGHVVTNFHVIQGGQAARVTLADQTVWPASLVGYAADKDLAVLKIEAPQEKLRALSVGSSNDLVVGQHVLAIGNPFGLDHTLSTGVISGLGREIRSVSGRPIQGAIQTDAAINPGNSGGPLLNGQGRLIGINTAIYSPTGASAGVGFAVPVDTVRQVVPQLIQHGRVVRPGMGIYLDEGQIAGKIGVTRGVIVIEVKEGSAAARAGLRGMAVDRLSGAVSVGDVIVGIDSEPVADHRDLYRILDERQVGQTVTVSILRGGRTRMEFPLTLEALAAD